MKAVKAIVVALSLALSSGAAGAQAQCLGPPVESSFSGIGLHFDLSPSGDRLAYIRRVGREQHLIVANIGTKLDRIAAAHISYRAVETVEWIDNERLIYGVPDRSERDWPAPGATQYFAASADLSKRIPLFEPKDSKGSPVAGKLVSLLPKEPDHAVFIGETRGNRRSQLFSVNLLDGSFEKLFTGLEGTNNWAVDALGNPAIQVQLNSRERELRFFGTNPYEESRPLWRRVLMVEPEPPSEVDEELGLRIVMFCYQIYATENPREFFVLARESTEAHRGLHVLNLDSKGIVDKALLFDHANIADVHFDPLDFEVIAVALDDQSRSIHFLEPEFQAHMEALKAYFGEGSRIYLKDFSQDRQRWLFSVENARVEDGIYLYDMAATHATRLLTQSDIIQPEG